MSNQISSPVVNASGKTRLRESLERAKARQGPSVGQWLMFPGYTLAKTIAGLGMDVSATATSFRSCLPLRLGSQRLLGRLGQREDHPSVNEMDGPGC